MPIPKFYVCTKCFNLTSKGESTQTCRCENSVSLLGIDCPRGYHLCYVCSASLAGGNSRWSWEACELCLAANSIMKESVGESLYLGRHSTMNGIAFPRDLKNEDLLVAATVLLEFSQSMQVLEKCALSKARELFLKNSKWKSLTYIPLSLWEKHFLKDPLIHFEAAIARIPLLIDELSGARFVSGHRYSFKHGRTRCSSGMEPPRRVSRAPS